MSDDHETYKESLRGRWGTTVIEEGWTAVPVRLLERQSQLGIKASELTVLLHLMKHWYSVDDAYVFPRQARIAKASGLGIRTVQRAIDSLEKKGLIEKTLKKEGRSLYPHNYYSLLPLVKKINSSPPITRRKPANERSEPVTSSDSEQEETDLPF